MFAKTTSILFLGLALAACDQEPKPTSTMDLEGVDVLLVAQGEDRWAVTFSTSLCVVGEVGDEVRFKAAFPSSGDDAVSWTTLDSTEVDDRDGCVSLAGELDLPVRAAHIEHVGVTARIEQLRDARSVDRMYGAGCADLDGASLDTALEPFTNRCD